MLPKLSKANLKNPPCKKADCCASDETRKYTI
jgi:hypothetical protein